MKVLSFAVILIGSFLVSKGKPVSEIKTHGNVYQYQYFGTSANSKKLFGALKNIEEKLNTTMDKKGASLNKTGTAGDSLSTHRGMAFTTKDRDNDAYSGGNCAVSNKGAWWYIDCHDSNLNGMYHHGQHNYSADGVNWYRWKGNNYSAKRAEMKIRPA